MVFSITKYIDTVSDSLSKKTFKEPNFMYARNFDCFYACSNNIFVKKKIVEL